MKAYAFEWNLFECEGNGAAVVFAGNVAGARKLVLKYMIEEWGTTNSLHHFNSTTPGPFWSKEAREAEKAQVAYFKSPNVIGGMTEYYPFGQ